MNDRKPPQQPSAPWAPASRPMPKVYLQSLEECAKPFPSIKLPSWSNWNRVTGGFRTHEYTILCGPTGSGKTQWLANLSWQLICAKEPHFVVSVENGDTDYMKRVMSAAAGFDVNTGDMVPVATLERIHRDYGAHFVQDLVQYSLHDNRIPVAELQREILWMRQNKGCKIAIVDNFNYLLDASASRDRLAEEDRVTHELVVMCKRNDIHVVMVMHPKKTDGGRVESEFDIKGSSTAVQEAQNVLLFNRPHKSDVDSGDRVAFDREMKIVKMRRRGKFVGLSMLFKTSDTVSYSEGNLI